MQKPGIYIIGAGAIGKALAVFLKNESKHVQLVRGRVDHITDTKERITVINHNSQSYTEDIEITTFSKLKRTEGVILVATKAFANPDIAKTLERLEGNFSIVLLQNGLNIEKPFASFKNVYRCVLFSTSQIKDGGQVIFKTVTASPIGNLQGTNAGLNTIIDQINTAEFSFRAESDIVKYIWEKVVINCAFNSICPLLETDNGIFYRNSEARKLAQIIIKECMALAKALNVILNQDEIEEKLLFISQRSEGQLISTYEDIRKKRRTEIDSLNLEISRLASEIGKSNLVANTQLLGEMIKLKSAVSFK